WMKEVGRVLCRGGEACQQSAILDEEQRASQRTHGSAPDPLRSWRPGDAPGQSGPEESDPGPEESDSRPDREVRAELQGSELWKRFYEIGTEMIITKAGRRMFPSVRVKVRNLDPCQQYYVAMDVMPVDSKRYRYVYHSSQWMVAGNTDHSCISPRLYVHPDSPCTGETWMRQVISFDRVKLTNNEMDDKGHIILQSMHKYKPRVHIIQHDPRMDLSQIQSLPAEGVNTFSFPETEFTTVTAYQNQQSNDDSVAVWRIPAAALKRFVLNILKASFSLTACSEEEEEN
uniref:T-box domain-containing protein n=1 Tax=Poecilia mexicana TaxID=48701 RepID=A0A3B3YFG0_9TELE